ncbi:MAG: RNA 2',3'-cyclic phosphodiesterase [Deltaproteobacteria bacterium]|nr:RNA 2',3'-cyclic phosphodiesterase [Deltaproteobacteria bacterium]
MNADRMIRSFLAIGIPGEILGEIGRLQERLKREIQGDIRWVRPDGIHLTLKFFGDIPEGAVSDISAVVEKAVAGHDPLDLSVSGAGVFPDLRRPRVLWLGMTGDVERLLTLQTTLERDLQRIGFPREERPFRPHLTLARIRSQRDMTGLGRALEKRGGCEAGRFVAAGLGLLKSDLTPQGAIYTKLREFPFAGR